MDAAWPSFFAITQEAGRTRFVIRDRSKMTGLIDAVSRQGGVARVRALLDAGFSRLDGRRGGRGRHPDRSSPRLGRDGGCRSLPRRSGRAGVVLTCVTRAKRLGLWVLAEDAPHVGAPPSASRLNLQNPKTTVHWSTPVQPREVGALEDGILNTLVIVASCQPFEAALCSVGLRAQSCGLISEGGARSAAAAAGGARRVLDAATPFSDSGLETIFASSTEVAAASDPGADLDTTGITSTS